MDGVTPAAARRARDWLAGLSLDALEEQTLRALAIAMCDQLAAEGPVCHDDMESGASQLELPEPGALIALDRDAVVRLGRQGGTVAADVETRILLGHLAVSYARVGDPQTCAALLRLAARAGHDDAACRLGWTFLADQQQPDGSFGLMAPELHMLVDPGRGLAARLALTADILFAAGARASALQAPQSGSG